LEGQKTRRLPDQAILQNLPRISFWAGAFLRDLESRNPAAISQRKNSDNSRRKPGRLGNAVAEALAQNEFGLPQTMLPESRDIFAVDCRNRRESVCLKNVKISTKYLSAFPPGTRGVSTQKRTSGITIVAPTLVSYFVRSTFVPWRGDEPGASIKVSEPWRGRPPQLHLFSRVRRCSGARGTIQCRLQCIRVLRASRLWRTLSQFQRSIP